MREAAAVDVGAAAGQRGGGLLPRHAAEHVLMHAGLLLMALQEDRRILDVGPVPAVLRDGPHDDFMVRRQPTRRVVDVVRRLAIGERRVFLEVLLDCRRLLDALRGQGDPAMSRRQQDEAFAHLRHAVVRGVETVGGRLDEAARVERLRELLVDLPTVRGVQPRHVLDHEEVRGSLAYQRGEREQQALALILPLHLVERGEGLTGRAGHVEHRIVRRDAQLLTQFVDVDGLDVPTDEAARLIVVFVGLLQALVVVHARQHLDPCVEQPARQAPSTAEEVNRLNHARLPAFLRRAGWRRSRRRRWSTRRARWSAPVARHGRRGGRRHGRPRPLAWRR